MNRLGGTWCLGLALGASAAFRAELHIHLDGAMSVDTLYEVVVRRNLSLPGNVGRPANVGVLRRFLDNIEPAWHRFDIVNDIIGGDVPTVSFIAERFVADQAASGVNYTEVRYDPVRLARSNYTGGVLGLREVVEAMRVGLVSGMAKYPGLEVHQLLCAMRGKPASACFEVAQLVAESKSSAPGGVVGLDLAGPEAQFPNPEYVDCFRHAKLQLGLRTTVHAGEGTTAEEVRSAVEDMLADRIGHGYAAAENATIMALLEDRQIHLEAAPSSAIENDLLWAIGSYQGLGLNFGLNTDDPADIFDNRDLHKIEEVVRDRLNFTAEIIERGYAAALKAAFAPASASPLIASATLLVA